MKSAHRLLTTFAFECSYPLAVFVRNLMGSASEGTNGMQKWHAECVVVLFHSRPQKWIKWHLTPVRPNRALQIRFPTRRIHHRRRSACCPFRHTPHPREPPLPALFLPTHGHGIEALNDCYSPSRVSQVTSTCSTRSAGETTERSCTATTLLILAASDRLPRERKPTRVFLDPSRICPVASLPRSGTHSSRRGKGSGVIRR